MKLIKTHTKCTDSATGLDGTVCAIEILKDGEVEYLFQPKGLNPETKVPLNRFPVKAWRLNVKDSDYEDRDVPIQDIGKLVKDTVSGYQGTIVSVIVHLNGCCHYVLQAPGVSQNGNPIRMIEVDPRSCEGVTLPPTAPPSPEDEFPQGGFGAS